MTLEYILLKTFINLLFEKDLSELKRIKIIKI